jgi:hypothetical protein
VSVGGVRVVAPALVRLPLDLAEPTEEEEQVADAHALAFQMALRRADLAERGPPAGRARERVRAQVGVQVRARVGPHATTGQPLDERPERAAPPADHTGLMKC